MPVSIHEHPEQPPTALVQGLGIRDEKEISRHVANQQTAARHRSGTIVALGLKASSALACVHFPDVDLHLLEQAVDGNDLDHETGFDLIFNYDWDQIDGDLRPAYIEGAIKVAWTFRF